MKKEKKVVKKVGAPKTKTPKVPKFQLLTYTLKAVIPTGMYANIQPEITVAAETIEQAERAVMPFIEAMFTKYRSDGSSAPTPVVSSAKSVPVAVKEEPKAAVAVKEEPKAPVAAPEAPIVLTVPFNRAKSAIESCTSSEALKLVSDQITKSVKLTQTEKNTLTMLVTDKSKTLNG